MNIFLSHMKIVLRFFLGIWLMAFFTHDVFAAVVSGTGFFITSSGYIVTNNHVVQGADAITVKDYRGNTYTASVKHTDRANDLAILKIEGNFSPLSIAKSSTMRRGDSVFTLGFPNTQFQGNSVKFTDGTISALSGVFDEPNSFQISVPIQLGNSGGPLINRDGSVVGVIVSKLNATAVVKSGGAIPEVVNYSVKSNYLLELIDTDPNISELIQAPVAKKTKQLDLPDLVSKSEQSVVFIVVKTKDAPSPVQQVQKAPSSTPEAKQNSASCTLNLPNGWAHIDTAALKASKIDIFATNQSIDASLMVTTKKRAEVGDLAEFAQSMRRVKSEIAASSHQTEIQQLQINNKAAWSFLVQGIDNTNKKDLTWLVTIIDCGENIAVLSAFTPTKKFSDNQEVLKSIAFWIK